MAVDGGGGGACATISREALAPEGLIDGWLGSGDGSDVAEVVPPSLGAADVDMDSIGADSGIRRRKSITRVQRTLCTF